MTEEKGGVNVSTDPERTVADTQFDAILEELGKPENTGRGYAKDAIVTIPGSLFVEFNQFANHMVEVMQGINKVAVSIAKTTEHYEEESYKFSIRFAQAHLDNIKAGNTIPSEELDRQDAVEKISEEKVSKKKKK